MKCFVCGKQLTGNQKVTRRGITRCKVDCKPQFVKSLARAVDTSTIKFGYTIRLIRGA